MSSSLERLKDSEHSFKTKRFQHDTEIIAAIKEANPDFIIHTACSYGRANESSLEILEANFLYGAKILESISKLDIDTNFINTGTALPPNLNLYTLSKHYFSHWGQAIAQQSAGKIRFLNVLLQNMYGPGDDPSKFTSAVILACQNEEPTFELTEGLQQRDWVYIDDVVSAFRSIIKNFNQLHVRNEIEVGSGTTRSVREFAETVKRLTKSNTELVFGQVPYRVNEPMLSQANLSAMAQIGWKPIFNLESGLSKTLSQEALK